MITSRLLRKLLPQHCSRTCHFAFRAWFGLGWFLNRTIFDAHGFIMRLLGLPV